MGVRQMQKLKMNKSKLSLLFLILYLMISCSESRFVVKQHNRLVENIFSEGQTKYHSNHYIRYKDPESSSIKDSCVQTDKLKKLVELVPNDQYSDPYCKFEVTYEYILSLRNYVENNKKRLTKKLTPITERQYHDTIFYHDSIYLDSVNPWGIIR